MDIFTRLHQKQPLFFDGAMGSMLLARGLMPGELPERLNLDRPEEITAIHKLYLEAGADIITANTFGANGLKMPPGEVRAAVRAGIACARAAGAQTVALDVGPLGRLLRPLGTLGFEDAYALFAEVMKAGAEAGADLALIETMSDLYECKAAILAAREHTGLPVFCSMTFDKNGRTFLGCDAQTAAVTLSAWGVDALGVNCSLGPAQLAPLVGAMLENTDKPVLLQANAGLPREENGQTVYDYPPEEYARHAAALYQKGAGILGGCCGTTPAHIRALKAAVEKAPAARIPYRPLTACTSGSRTVALDGRLTVIGERINPTGKKKLQAALRQNDMAYILSEAIGQGEAGADVLDVNAGLPGLDEKAALPRIISEIQGISPLPLQIDSSDPGAIEAALRVYNGKPIVNSVSGKQASLDAILPLCKKYGALVVGLTLDENGIPETAGGRLAIARKIVSESAKHGIPETDILIDCLVLTASAQQRLVRETLRAVSLCKRELGVKTVLGVSNVSFGLPARPLLGSVFFSAALGAGLDAAIINPLSEPFRQAADAWRVVSAEDRDAGRYIKRYANPPAPAAENTAPAPKTAVLSEIIEQGRREEAAGAVRALLATQEPLEIVSSSFIPALNLVGERFSEGTLFLPQLMQSAAAVQAGFEALRVHMEAQNIKQKPRGTILLATVKGDIHDIGKNIARMILQSYGYTVIDLGKDVPAQTIVETIKAHDIKLCGLSALMTTTVMNIKAVIDDARAAGLTCQFMVGGAVLTEEYARLAGADFYAPDAISGARIAKEVFRT